jgi:hypothetical protein
LALTPLLLPLLPPPPLLLLLLLLQLPLTGIPTNLV